MKRLLWPFAGVSLALCSCVLSKEPIGRIPEEIDPADWEGVWVHEESFDVDAVVAVVKLASSEEARFDIFWLDDGGSELQLRKTTGVLRELDDSLFLNVQWSRDPSMPSTRYYWARIEKDGDFARAWVPGYDAVEKMVTDGVLSGDIDKPEYEITLDELNAREAELVSSPAFPAIPITFRRIGK